MKQHNHTAHPPSFVFFSTTGLTVSLTAIVLPLLLVCRYVAKRALPVVRKYRMNQVDN